MVNKNNLFLTFVIISCLCVLLYLAAQNEVCEGGADNYWHYFFSKYAYKYPQFFLHHWGKPIFILLSCPFAQFGLIGIKIFNILCGIFSAIVCYKFCEDIELKINWLVIPILIFSPLYFLVSQSALTEPLFGLILIFSSYLLYRESFFWGTIVASFLLFSRSEGLFIVMYYCFYLLLTKKIKYIPLLSTAFIIYAFVGFFSGHNFFWFFTEMPYAVESPYGQGEWTHFFKYYRTIFGTPHVILLLPGVAFLVIRIIKNKEWNIFKPLSTNTKVFLLVFIPAFLFFAFHIVAWRYGKFGSAGLERVISCIIPCTAILCMYTINGIAQLKLPQWATYTGVMVCLYFVVSFPFQLHHLPLKAVSDEKAEWDAAKWLINNGKKEYPIYYAHPAVIFYADLNPFDKELNKECFEYYEECNRDKKKPFYYFWDSSFSEFSCKTSTKDLESCPGMKRIKEFVEGNFWLYIYEFTPVESGQKNYNGKTEESTKQIQLQAANEKFVWADKTKNSLVVATSDNGWEWETFSLIMLENNKCAIRTYDNHFFSAEITNLNEIAATRTVASDWETFTLVDLEDNFVAFKAVNSKYLSLDEKTLQIFAKSESIGEKEKFKLIQK